MNLDWKVASAFGTGAVLASGIVYFAVRPVDVARPEVAQQQAPRPVVAKAPPVAPEVAPPPPIAALPIRPEAHAHVAVREKPSPMPPPVRRQKEAAIAQNEQPASGPPVPVAPAPQPAVVAPPVTAASASPAPPAASAENVPVQNVSMPSLTSTQEARVPHMVTLTAGTILAVRIGETLSSSHNQVGDTFLATLTQPLVIDGFVIAERGARVEGRVVDAAQAGRVKGGAHLSISVVRLATSDGQNIRIRTEPYIKDGASSTGTDTAKIGGGAALGAIIGAIVGGGKGAAIGAGAGGAAGAGDVMLTRGQSAEIRVETRVSFRVQDPVTITERLD